MKNNNRINTIKNIDGVLRVDDDLIQGSFKTLRIYLEKGANIESIKDQVEKLYKSIYTNINISEEGERVGAVISVNYSMNIKKMKLFNISFVIIFIFLIFYVWNRFFVAKTIQAQNSDINFDNK